MKNMIPEQVEDQAKTITLASSICAICQIMIEKIDELEKNRQVFSRDVKNSGNLFRKNLERVIELLYRGRTKDGITEEEESQLYNLQKMLSKQFDYFENQYYGIVCSDIKQVPYVPIREQIYSKSEVEKLLEEARENGIDNILKKLQ